MHSLEHRWNILPQACKKLTAIENNQTKTRNPKTRYVHTIIVTFRMVTRASQF
jgi:hypothetical protein